MIDILYIAGSGRSGSTLLERILGQIDGCVSVGELRHLWRRDPAEELCGCGLLLSDCDFWNRVLNNVFGSQSLPDFDEIYTLQKKVDRIRYIPQMLGIYRGMTYSDNSAAYKSILESLYSAIHDATGSRVIIDSSKDISTLFYLMTLPKMRVRIVHMIRDSRAVAFSWMRKKVRSHVKDNISYMSVYSPYKSAADWAYRNLLTELARKKAYDYFQLRYEDLLSQPRNTVAQLASFIGLEGVDLSFVSHHSITLTQDTHTAAGNPMRFQKENVSLHLDDAWQGEIKPLDKVIVTAMTWPLLLRYGYRHL
jgi:hypothetical protein